VTSPAKSVPTGVPGGSFSAEDATEAALHGAFTGALTAWLTASTSAIMSGGMVPDLAMMLGPAVWASYAKFRVRNALRTVWLKVFGRTGTDLRGYIDTYTEALPNRLDGLPELANRHASQALAQALPTGDVEEIRKAVQDALAPSAFDGYVNRLAASEASISVNAARHELAMTAYREGVRIDKVWRTRRDDRVRHTHEKAEGQQVPFTAPFWVGGVPMAHPGDPTAPIHEVANCRCKVDYKLHEVRPAIPAGVRR